MKHGFTLVEVMFGNAMLLILVAGFVKITEQTLEQIQLKTLKMSWPHIWTSGLWQS